MTQDKNSLRIKSQEKRKSILAMEKRFNSEKIVERILQKELFAQASVIMMYMPTDYEPDIQPLIEKVLSLGKTVCIPFCREDKQIVAVVPEDWDDLSVNCFGIIEPWKDRCTVIDPKEMRRGICSRYSV